MLCPRKVQSIDNILPLSISFLWWGFLGYPVSGTERTHGRHTDTSKVRAVGLRRTGHWGRRALGLLWHFTVVTREVACVRLVAATGCPVGSFFICPSVLSCVTGALKINKNNLYRINFIQVISRDKTKKKMLTILE